MCTKDDEQHLTHIENISDKKLIFHSQTSNTRLEYERIDKLQNNDIKLDIKEVHRKSSSLTNSANFECKFQFL